MLETYSRKGQQMNYYHHMLEAKVRRDEAMREFERRELVAEARAAKTTRRFPRLKLSIRLPLPRRQPAEPCPTCPEYA
jgi:hypothetical protein